ncbi:hypothetical protein KEJ18_04780 [Candidatus Bathyarchaeota archaeon]|nr:hypothetical protein [Candidatus Bathyarchaeota archaeon]
MKDPQRTIWEELEKGFGSGTKFRILLQMALNPNETFTKYALVKATGIRTPSVESQLKVLVKIGWIKEYSFTPKTYQINLENEVVKQIVELFQKIKLTKGSTKILY